MQPIEQQIKQAQADFLRLQKDQQLPPLMEIKLAFLKALITKAPEAHDIGQRLEPLQSQSIAEMPRQTQQKLFIQIVRCLSGRDTVTFCKGQRAYIRRQGKIFSWQKFYLDCDTNSLAFRRKRQSQEVELRLELQKVNLTKYLKQYKGKHVIAIDYEDLKYVVGFDQEITCERIHKIIGNLIDQKRQWVETKFDNLQFIQQREAQRLALPAHKIKKIMNHQEYQHLLALEQRVRSVEMHEEEDFKLFRAFQEGRILVGKNGSVKLQMLVKGFSPIQVASCFVQMALWNSSVELLQISSRPRHNCLLARLVTNKYSIFSFQRQANVAIHYFKPCSCQHNTPSNQSFLLIEDLPTEEKPQSAGIRMNIKQILQFVPNKQDENSLLVVILTQAKFNGLCSESDNLAMTLHLVDKIQNFLVFLNEKGSTFTGYFQAMTCPCGGKQSFDLESCLSFPTERQEVEVGSNEKISLKALDLNYQFSDKRVIATMEDICNGLVNQEFLQLLKHRAHYCYFLKHKFTENEDHICTYKDDNRNFLKEGIKWELKGNQLKFIDVEVLAAQKDILKMILKQLSSNIISGKSIMNMSLPVQIFDRRSMLDAIADSYGFLAAFTSKIVEANDLVQQMKYMVCAFMFLHATCPSVEKPFNPILGQTYQGKIGELPICLQQISHHPPISSILIKTKYIQVFGNVQVVVDMGLNSVYSYLCHWLKAKVISTNTQYLIKLPDVQMEGVMYGDRIYKVVNKGFILQTKHNLFAEFSVAKNKKRVYESTNKLHSSDIVGGIFKVKQEFVDKVRNCPKPKSFEGLKPDHVVETCCLLTGKWYGDIYFDKVCYKSKEKGPFPFKAQRMKYVLPSDSIWREDLLFKIWKDNERSNREKERLQNLQRNDKKLREKFKKNR